FTLYLLRAMLLILIITIFIIPTKISLAKPSINVPLDSWIYPAISRLETLQTFEGNSTIALNTKPLTRYEITSLIDTALSNLQKGKVELKQADLLLMEKLAKEFHAELLVLNLDNLNPESTLKIEPYFTQKMNLFYPENINLEKLNLLSELGAKISATTSENTALYLNVLAYTEGEPLFQLQIKQAYINLNLPSFKITISDSLSFLPDSMVISNFSLQVGRDYMRWGPGYQGSLTISDNSAAFDMLKYSGTIDLNNSGESIAKISFTKFFSLLDTLNEQNRYFSGQRLEYKPFDNL
ncbi:unnamed protein product, partial [marine sediment metagenome]